ncbi:MAG: YHS domain-containing (seleno)protein [Halofilum sp. (in: g-proteobacteria)]|nr:YHS domain-containing (seleno)protein [Halofilum sp. (in: g-proteobacteria)]
MLRKCIGAAFLTSAIPVALVGPLQNARASDLDRVKLIEKTWDGLAIKGHDPVAYFELNRSMKGSAEFRYEWLGQEWYFVNARHRDLFASNPIKYVPQYGGYCSESHEVTDIDPTAWRIIGSRLYLFFSERNARQFESSHGARISRSE